MVLSHMSMPPSMTPAMVPSRDQSGFTLRTFLSSFAMSSALTLCRIGVEHVARAAGLDGGEGGFRRHHAGQHGVVQPLMRGTFMKPAAQPISAPPGKASRGIACQPPSVSARAP